MNIPQTLLVSPEWLETQDARYWLTPLEMEACQAPPSAQRRMDKMAGRIALKRLLSETFTIDPLLFTVGSEGPAPCLRHWLGPDGIVVSLSHSGGWGAASWAWAREEETVGLDVQRVRLVHPGLAARVLTVSEQEQDADILLLWALKEAGIKARRQPWGRALREVVVSLRDLTSTEGAAEIFVPGELPFRAVYSRIGDLWLARAAR